MEPLGAPPASGNFQALIPLTKSISDLCVSSDSTEKPWNANALAFVLKKHGLLNLI